MVHRDIVDIFRRDRPKVNPPKDSNQCLSATVAGVDGEPLGHARQAAPKVERHLASQWREGDRCFSWSPPRLNKLLSFVRQFLLISV